MEDDVQAGLEEVGPGEKPLFGQAVRAVLVDVSEVPLMAGYPSQPSNRLG